jgi:hypothetical protein
MFLPSFVWLLLLQAGAPANGLDVQAHEGQVTVHAQRVPLSKVLDRLAQQTGMKVVYESSPPSTPISASFEGVPPRDAVERLLEGQGLAYVFRTDATGRKVDTLLVSGEAGSGTGGGRSASSGSGLPQNDSMEYTAEVVDDAPDYEEPPQPPEANIPVPDLALPSGMVQPPGAFNPGGAVDPPPSFPGGPSFPRTPGAGTSGAPSFPGPVSNPFPH